MLRYTGSPTSNYSNPAGFEQFHDYATDVSRGMPVGAAIPFARPVVVDDDRPSPIQAKLQQFIRLDDEETAAIVALSFNAKPFGAGHILVHEGNTADYVYLMVQGIACRYKLLPDGKRQILGFLIPGDLCDLHFVAHKPDHSVALLGQAKIAKIPSRKISDLLNRYPRIERALSMGTLLDIAILRQWLLNMGQRNAVQRLSHLFCETKCRLATIGHVDSDGSFEMPVNQSALADSTGLSSVHVNRILKRLRNDGLIKLRKRRLTILDPERLATLAGFNDDYLKMKPCRR